MKDKLTPDQALAELQILRKEYTSLRKSYKKAISDFRLTNKKLKESEEKYRLIFEHSGDAILFTSPNGEIYAANPEACKIYGMTEEEICAAGRDKLLDANDPQVNAGLKIRSETGVYRGELNMVRKGGIVFPTLVSSIVFSDKKGNQRTCTIIRDNTENKENIREIQRTQKQLSEQKIELQSVFDCTPSMMCILNEQLHVLNANKAFRKSTGWPESNSMKACGVLGCINCVTDKDDCGSGEDCKTCALRKIIDDTLQTGRSHLNLEHSTTLRAAYVKKNVVLLVSTVRINSGGENRVLLTLSDITQLKNTELALLESQKHLELFNHYLVKAREEEKGRISREIHDHFGQSLTALKLDLHVFKQTYSEDKEATSKIGDMIGLVSDLINDVQRISTDLRPGMLDDLGLQATCEWYCNEFEKRSNIRCILNIGKGDYSDPGINLSLFRILQEALTNVIRHSGATIVNVGLKKQREGTRLSIRDNGKGILNQEIYSANSLGLAGIRERSRQFNGDLKIVRRNGTLLTVIIPDSQKPESRLKE